MIDASSPLAPRPSLLIVCLGKRESGGLGFCGQAFLETHDLALPSFKFVPNLNDKGGEMSTGRKIVRKVEEGLTAGVLATRAMWREVFEVLDELPKAVDRVATAVSDVIDHADEGTTEEPPSAP